MAKSLLNRGGHTETAEMSFIDHLEALRWHIIRSVLAILVVAGVIFYFHEWVFDYIIAGPINPNFISYSALCNFSHFIHAGDALCMKGIKVTDANNHLWRAVFGQHQYGIGGRRNWCFPLYILGVLAVYKTCFKA